MSEFISDRLAITNFWSVHLWVVCAHDAIDMDNIGWIKTPHENKSEEPQKDGNLCDFRQNPDGFKTWCDIHWHVIIQVIHTSKRLRGFVAFLSRSTSTLQRLMWSDNSWTPTNRTTKNRWAVLLFKNTAWCWKANLHVSPLQQWPLGWLHGLACFNNLSSTVDPYQASFSWLAPWQKYNIQISKVYIFIFIFIFICIFIFIYTYLSS